MRHHPGSSRFAPSRRDHASVAEDKMRSGGNLGATRLKTRSRAEDPMRAYDALPSELRDWVAHAARPWSPRSCLRLWRRALAEEGCPARARARLDRAQAAMLARDSGLA